MYIFLSSQGVEGMIIYHELQLKIYSWTGNQPGTTASLAIQADIHDPYSPNYHTLNLL